MGTSLDKRRSLQQQVEIKPISTPLSPYKHLKYPKKALKSAVKNLLNSGKLPKDGRKKAAVLIKAQSHPTVKCFLNTEINQIPSSMAQKLKQGVQNLAKKRTKKSKLAMVNVFSMVRIMSDYLSVFKILFLC